MTFVELYQIVKANVIAEYPDALFFEGIGISQVPISEQSDVYGYRFCFYTQNGNGTVYAHFDINQYYAHSLSPDLPDQSQIDKLLVLNFDINRIQVQFPDIIQAIKNFDPDYNGLGLQIQIFLPVYDNDRTDAYYVLTNAEKTKTYTVNAFDGSVK